MKKKILIILMIAAMMLCLSACANSCGKKTSEPTAPPESAAPTASAEPETKPAPEQAVEPAGVVYGVQVLATSKKMKPTDAFFKGYTPLEVRSGKLYKYILVAGDDLAAVRKKKEGAGQEIPGLFPGLQGRGNNHPHSVIFLPCKGV